MVHCQLAHPQSKLPAAFLCASQVQAWELLSDSRELQVLPTVSAPGTVWDALQGMAGKAALAGAHGGWVGCGHCTGSAELAASLKPEITRQWRTGT